MSNTFHEWGFCPYSISVVNYILAWASALLVQQIWASQSLEPWDEQRNEFPR